jgi:hypothetical protein
MPYTVLRQSKTVADRIDVMGEFATEQEACDFAENARADDSDDDSDFSVESPPPPRMEKNSGH